MMSSFFETAVRPGPRLVSRSLTVALVGLAAAALAVSLAVALGDSPPPGVPLTVLGGLAGLGVLALALARYETAAALGLLLLGVVFVEPSPPDAVLGVVMAVALVTGRFTLRSVPFPMLALVVALLVLNLISAIFAVFPGRAVFFFSITAYLCFFALWLTGYVNSERRAALVVRPLVAGAVASAAVGVAVLFLNFPGKSLVDFSDGQRARGFFKDPNVFGPFLVVVALIVLSEILEPRLLKSRVMTKLGLLLVLSLGILFAYSRAAWLNAVIGVVVMLLVYSLRRGGSLNVTKILTAVVVALAAGSIVLAATGSAQFLEQRAHRQSYDTQRFAGQERGLQLAEHHPLGIGPGQFERTVGIASHSTYVRALAEQGILGLATVLALLLGTLALATTNAVRGRDTYGIGSAPLLGAWVGMMANSAFVDTLHWRQLWLVAALIWVAAMRPARGSTPAY
jgi:O-antigen ligase